MNIRSLVLWAVLIVAAAISAEGSLLVRRSLLQPRESTSCFTCRSTDRPPLYPLFAYWGRMTDAFVKMFNAAVAHVKEYPLIE